MSVDNHYPTDLTDEHWDLRNASYQSGNGAPADPDDRRAPCAASSMVFCPSASPAASGGWSHGSSGTGAPFMGISNAGGVRASGHL